MKPDLTPHPCVKLNQIQLKFRKIETKSSDRLHSIVLVRQYSYSFIYFLIYACNLKVMANVFVLGSPAEIVGMLKTSPAIRVLFLRGTNLNIQSQDAIRVLFLRGINLNIQSQDTIRYSVTAMPTECASYTNLRQPYSDPTQRHLGRRLELLASDARMRKSKRVPSCINEAAIAH
jgi:hypothetical protein